MRAPVALWKISRARITFVLLNTSIEPSGRNRPIRSKRSSAMRPSRQTSSFDWLAPLERKFGDAPFGQRVVVVGYADVAFHGQSG